MSSADPAVQQRVQVCGPGPDECPGGCARVRERQKSVDRRCFVAAGRAIEARGNNLRLRFCSAIRIALARCRASAHDLVGLGILSII